MPETSATFAIDESFWTPMFFAAPGRLAFASMMAQQQAFRGAVQTRSR